MSVPAATQGERVRRPVPLRMPGNRSRLVLFDPAASTDACGRHMLGAPMRRTCGWTTRITQAELAARNRLARFPAARCAARSASRRPPNLLTLRLFERRDPAFSDSRFKDSGSAIQ